MAKTAKERMRSYRARGRKRRAKVLAAIEAMPPGYADDCKMWVSPPGPDDKRPRINWDIDALTHGLMEAHAVAHEVTLDEVLYEVGVMYLIGRPRLYAALKSAKINVSNN